MSESYDIFRKIVQQNLGMIKGCTRQPGLELVFIHGSLVILSLKGFVCLSDIIINRSTIFLMYVMIVMCRCLSVFIIFILLRAG